jgi:chemotaxis protein CheZ
MPPSNSLTDQKLLRRRLDEAHAEAREPLSRDAVAEIIRSMLTTLAGDMSAEDVRLYHELEGLAKYIHDARQEIAAIRPADITDQHIPVATDELDAVVGATEKATFEIFDACDVIGAVATTVNAEAAAKLNEAVTRIFEACNFQDITGQRIAKVVKALKSIETQVDALVAAFGDEVKRVAPPPPPPPSPSADPDAGLLHGPQMAGAAIDQDEIDRLLASFD